MTAPSPAAVRMRRTRERRRQGDVIVSVEVGPNMTSDLADLGWLPAPDRGDKNAVTRALTELIERAIEVLLAGQSQLHARNPAQHDRQFGRASLAPRRSARRPRSNCDCLSTIRSPIARHCA
jgi:hypothetical protein